MSAIQVTSVGNKVNRNILPSVQKRFTKEKHAVNMYENSDKVSFGAGKGLLKAVSKLLPGSKTHAEEIFGRAAIEAATEHVEKSYIHTLETTSPKTLHDLEPITESVPVSSGQAETMPQKSFLKSKLPDKNNNADYDLLELYESVGEAGGDVPIRYTYTHPSQDEELLKLGPAPEFYAGDDEVTKVSVAPELNDKIDNKLQKAPTDKELKKMIQMNKKPATFAHKENLFLAYHERLRNSQRAFDSIPKEAFEQWEPELPLKEAI